MSVAEPAFDRLHFEVGQIFTPGAPINSSSLFAGRVEQVGTLVDAISQPGFHAVLFGDRGVGKTSLANILNERMAQWAPKIFFPRTNCDGGDTFSTLWRKVLQDIQVEQRRPAVGFSDRDRQESVRLVDSLPKEIRPDDVRRVLAQMAPGIPKIICIDEYDRPEDVELRKLMADTIKSLSDFNVQATLLLIGVADSVDELIKEHPSVERPLVQVRMPRMSMDECKQIVTNGLPLVSMTIADSALDLIATLSQGLPHITHLLALHSARAALHDRRLDVGKADVSRGIAKALDQWQQSIRRAYHEATKSQQPDALYKHVLLACALAKTDDLNFFTAAAVRAPLKVIAGRDLDIPGFSRHLKEFSQDDRGNILSREGQRHRLRYRFASPLMRPYVIMRGVTDGVITPMMIPKAL